MRRGIGTALVNRIADVLRARGAERLEVTANPDALGFYDVAGFIGCGVAGTDLAPRPAWCWPSTDCPSGDQAATPRQQHRTSRQCSGQDTVSYPGPPISKIAMRLAHWERQNRMMLRAARRKNPRGRTPRVCQS
jgi:hypothetical protein